MKYWSMLTVACAVLASMSCRLEVVEDHSPKRMCSGDTLYATAKLSRKVDKIEVFDNEGTKLAHVTKRKRINVTVPNIRHSQLPFLAKAKKGGSKGKKKIYFELFDNPHLTGDIDASDIQFTQEVTTTIRGETRDGAVITYGQGVDVSQYSFTHCWVEHEISYTFRNVTWNLVLNRDHSPKIRVTNIHNTTGFNLKVSKAGPNPIDIEIPVGQIGTINPPTRPDLLLISMPLSTPVKIPCGTVIRDIPCNNVSAGNFNKEDAPDPWGCFGSPPVVQLVLICDTN